MTASPLRTAAVLAALHDTLDGHPYLQTSDGRVVTIEVYDRVHADALARHLHGLTVGHLTGARIAAIWTGTITGVPVEIIHLDVTARRAA